MLKTQTMQTMFIGSIHPGQEVFSQDEQLIGLVTRTVPNGEEPNSHLVIRTRRLLGRQKIMPVENVSSIEPKGILLSITRDVFLGLPDYKSDAAIADEVDRVLWKETVLRKTDYGQVDVRVKDGFVFLSGYVISTQNKRLIENAVRIIAGILGLKIYLIADDELLLKVAGALGQIEHSYGTKFFTSVDHGVVGLNGEVNTLDIRSKAERCAAGIPWVRGVINNVRAPGIDIKTEDQRFLQPAIGQEIYFGDGLTGTVMQVVINPNNRRVTGMIVQRRTTHPQQKIGPLTGNGEPYPRHFIYIPVSAIHHLTHSAGFLRKSDQDTIRVYDFDDFDLAHFSLPGEDWAPPYPYCPEDVLFPAEMKALSEDEFHSAVPLARVGFNEVLLKG
jgi:osmotically-inducible protein OsmY/sporulation protein YlmC with PRC-barrel domain